MRKFLYLIALFAPWSAWGQQICALPAVPTKAALTGSMVMPIDDCSNTQQVSVNQLITFINSNGSPNLAAATGTLGTSNGGTGTAGTLTGIPYANGSSAWTAASTSNIANLFGCGGSSSLYLRGDGSCAAPTGTGSVTSVSVQTANGFSGTVQYANSTPIITLSTTPTGPLIGTSGGALASAASTDIIGLFSGTPSSSCFLNGAGACTAPSSGSVTSIQSYTIVTSSRALTASACFVLVNASSGNVTVTLPSASGMTHPCAVKRIDNSSNTVTIATTSGQTIDGLSTQTIQYQYTGVILNYDNSGSPNWWVM